MHSLRGWTVEVPPYTFGEDMSYMFRLNHDGTVDRCDDTPDQYYRGDKYMRSTMRKHMWVYVPEELNRVYIHEEEVPQIIKMFDLLEQ